MEEKKRNYAGKVKKLSGWGWSYHERLLRVTGNILGYIRKVPEEFNGNFSHILQT